MNTAPNLGNKLENLVFLCLLERPSVGVFLSYPRFDMIIVMVFSSYVHMFCLGCFIFRTSLGSFWTSQPRLFLFEVDSLWGVTGNEMFSTGSVGLKNLGKKMQGIMPFSY